MADVLLCPQAEADIASIADCTINRRGGKQAHPYVTELRTDIASLSAFPQRFPVHQSSGLGLRRMASGHHLVFYLAVKKVVEIVRVGHQMNVPTWETL